MKKAEWAILNIIQEVGNFVLKPSTPTREFTQMSPNLCILDVELQSFLPITSNVGKALCRNLMIILRIPQEKHGGAKARSSPLFVLMQAS